MGKIPWASEIPALPQFRGAASVPRRCLGSGGRFGCRKCPLPDRALDHDHHVDSEDHGEGHHRHDHGRGHLLRGSFRKRFCAATPMGGVRFRGGGPLPRGVENHRLRCQISPARRANRHASQTTRWLGKAAVAMGTVTPCAHATTPIHRRIGPNIQSGNEIICNQKNQGDQGEKTSGGIAVMRSAYSPPKAERTTVRQAGRANRGSGEFQAQTTPPCAAAKRRTTRPPQDTCVSREILPTPPGGQPPKLR